MYKFRAKVHISHPYEIEKLQITNNRFNVQFFSESLEEIKEELVLHNINYFFRELGRDRRRISTT